MNKNEMIPFTLDEYNTGRYNVESRDGLSVRIVCTDIKAYDEFCIVGLEEQEDGREIVRLYTDEGYYNRFVFEFPKSVPCGYQPHSEHDLFLIPKPTKKEKLELPQTSIPRELCKKCYDWCSQEDVGEHDIPHCINEIEYCCRDYLRNYRNDCPKFNEL